MRSLGSSVAEAVKLFSFCISLCFQMTCRAYFGALKVKWGQGRASLKFSKKREVEDFRGSKC